MRMITADMPDTPPVNEDAQGKEPALDLVPSFATEDEKAEPWSQLTTTNADYERLWSMPNGSSASHDAPAEQPDPPPTTTPSSPEPETPPPAVAASLATSANVATPGFTGTLVTGSEVLNASIVIGSAGIVLWGGGAEIGTWEHSNAKIARLTYARFAIQAEGETLTFTADDPAGLDNAIAGAVKTEPETAPPSDPVPTPVITTVPRKPAAAEPASKLAVNADPSPEPTAGSVEADRAAPVRRPRIKNFRPEGEATISAASPAPTKPDPPSAETAAATEGDDFTIADSVRATSSRTVKARRFLPNDYRGIAIKSVVAIGLVTFLAGVAYSVMLLMGGGTREATATNQPTATAPPITVVITTAPLVTVATTAPLPDTTLFQTDPAILTQRWNSLAEVTAPNMVLFSDVTSPFILLLTPNVTMEGVLDPAAGNVTMRATPTGTPEGDGAILNALGILLGTADPTLDGGDRKALLGQLGLDVDQPELGGINGSLTHNGLAYRMVYQAEQNTLELVITPEGAVTTTAAN